MNSLSSRLASRGLRSALASAGLSVRMLAGLARADGRGAGRPRLACLSPPAGLGVRASIPAARTAARPPARLLSSWAVVVHARLRRPRHHVNDQVRVVDPPATGRAGSRPPARRPCSLAGEPICSMTARRSPPTAVGQLGSCGCKQSEQCQHCAFSGADQAGVLVTVGDGHRWCRTPPGLVEETSHGHGIRAASSSL